MQNNLEAFWLPFAPNRRFRAHPRLLANALHKYYRAALPRLYP